MTRLPLLVGACLLVAGLAIAGLAVTGAFAGSGATQLLPDTETAGTETDSPSAEEYVLVVEDAETGERLLAEPVAEGTTVALNYTHSVEKTPVLDVYEVNGTQLEMVRMEFHSYGAGLPARADVNVTEDGTFVFDPEGSYDHVYVTPGRIAGHELLVGERTYDLVELSNASSVKIYVERQSATTETMPGETTTETTPGEMTSAEATTAEAMPGENRRGDAKK